MEGKHLAVFWISLASILAIKGILASDVFTLIPQSGCHSSDIIIDCKYYANIESTKSANLVWQFKSENGWKRLAQIRRGNRKEFNNAHFGDRLVLHTNGSLEIKSLEAKDARLYMCTVSQPGQRDKHVVELSVKCDGRVTMTRQDVCVEDDVLLDCEAKQRTNPHHFKDIKWQKYEGSSWSLVLASYNNSTIMDDGTILHSNGTLLIPAGRQPGDAKYKCTVIKNIDRHLKERHIVVLRNLKCHKERLNVKATIKTTKGRETMTTATPVLGTTVAMETTTSEYSTNSATAQSTPQSTIETPKGLDSTTATPIRATVAMETTPTKMKSISSSTMFTSTANIQTTKEPVTKTTAMPVLQTTASIQTTSESTPGYSTSTVDVKTMEGRAAITTAKPILKTTSVMETTPEQKNISPVFQSTVGASVKTTKGRTAMTTAKPVLATTVAMETTPSSSSDTESPSPTTAESHVCGGLLTSISGGFHSPNYPKAYPANSYCKWTITVPLEYKAIHIRLDHMNLEHEDNCQNDYISIIDELGNQVGCRQCGSYNKPITFRVQGRTAMIEFNSDSTVHKTGFKLTYKAVL